MKPTICVSFQSTDAIVNNNVDVHASDDNEATEDKLISPPIIVSPPVDSPSKNSIDSIDSYVHSKQKSDDDEDQLGFADTDDDTDTKFDTKESDDDTVKSVPSVPSEDDKVENESKYIENVKLMVLERLLISTIICCNKPVNFVG